MKSHSVDMHATENSYILFSCHSPLSTEPGAVLCEYAGTREELSILVPCGCNSLNTISLLKTENELQALSTVVSLA